MLIGLLRRANCEGTCQLVISSIEFQVSSFKLLLRLMIRNRKQRPQKKHRKMEALDDTVSMMDDR